MRKNVAIIGIVLIAFLLIGATVVDAKGYSGGGGRSFSSSSGGFKSSSTSFSGKTSSVSSVKSVSTLSSKPTASKLTVTNTKAYVTSASPRYTSSKYVPRTRYVNNYYSGMPMTDMFLMYYLWYGLGHMAADNDGNAVYVIDNDGNGTKGQAVQLVDKDGKAIPYTEEAPKEEPKEMPLGILPILIAGGAAFLFARGRLK